MSNITELANLPDLSFIDNATLQDVRDEMISDYLAKLSELGEKAELGTAHPDRLIMYAAAAQIYQCMQYIDRGAKMNFLKYSEGDFLDNLAAYKGLMRNTAERATLTLEFTLSAPQTEVVPVPGGTRVKTDSNKYFITDNYIEIPVGELTGKVTATAYEGGTAYNGVAVGEIKTLVDPVGYIQSVTNITVSRGGADIESDDNLTLRIYQSPSTYSVAGPAAAYEYWARFSRGDIADVKAYSPSASEVNIVFILKDGVLPDEQDLAEMEDYLKAKPLRPLTDLVTAMAPTETVYNINLKYFINTEDEQQSVAIQSAVQSAVNDYISWQRVIGRDINPSKIYQFVMSAGAKRIEITAPTFMTMAQYSIGKVGTVNIVYGGTEDD